MSEVYFASPVYRLYLRFKRLFDHRGWVSAVDLIGHELPEEELKVFERYSHVTGAGEQRLSSRKLTVAMTVQKGVRRVR